MITNLIELVKDKKFDTLGYLKEEIVLCESCKGVGEINYDEMTDYHHREYKTCITKCDTCGGKGRYYKQKIELHGRRFL